MLNQAWQALFLPAKRLNQEIRGVRKRLLKTTSWCMQSASNPLAGADQVPKKRTKHRNA
jgi:hypothetical protein